MSNGRYHGDIIKWKHFPRNWPFVWGIHWSPVNSLHKGQWRGALMFSLICTWINDRVNNRNFAAYFFSCDQAAKNTSFCPSVCLSVTPFWLCSGHRIIMKYLGVITIDKSNVHARGQGQRSKVKVTRDKKIANFDPNWAFPDCNSSFNLPMATKWCTKLDVV